jgi:hypothetical protein
MANVALKATPAVSVFTDEFLRTIIVAIIAYWGLLAAALPVTIFDSHVHNLARLAVAENAGFWQTSAWNSIQSTKSFFPGLSTRSTTRS